MANTLSPKVKPLSLKLLLGGLAIVILMNIIARFDLLPNLLDYQPNIITIIGSLFLFMEVGIWSIIQGKKKMNVVDIMIGVTAGLALLGVIASALSMSISLLNPIQGLVEIGLLAFVLIEIYR